MRWFRFLFLVLLFPLSFNALAGVDPTRYGVAPFADTLAVQERAGIMADSFLAAHPMMATDVVISGLEILHPMQFQTADFYLLLSLCLILGLIRFIDTRYFYNLFRAFLNPTLSNRQLKDQLQGAGLPNLMMNIFFAFSVGAYIYYIVKFFTPNPSGVIAPSVLILMLVVGTAVIYLAKYAAVRFSGWAFRVEGITEHYLFNVFLINKVMAVALIPFIIILAFADKDWAQHAVIISFITTGIFILNRYIRSWQVFGSFFQYSKFHFFMYLCASELLPIAVLMKLLVKGLMFY